MVMSKSTLWREFCEFVILLEPISKNISRYLITLKKAYFKSTFRFLALIVEVGSIFVDNGIKFRF